MYQLFAGYWPYLADRARTAEGMNRTDSSVATNDDVQSRPRFGSTWSASPCGGSAARVAYFWRFRCPWGGSWGLFRGSAALVAYFWCFRGFSLEVQIPGLNVGAVAKDSVLDDFRWVENRDLSFASGCSPQEKRSEPLGDPGKILKVTRKVTVVPNPFGVENPQQTPMETSPILRRWGVRLRQMAKLAPPAVWPFARGGRPNPVLKLGLTLIPQGNPLGPQTRTKQMYTGTSLRFGFGVGMRLT